MTTATDTIALLEVSTQRPVIDSEGLQSFRSVLGADTDGVRASAHQAHVKSPTMLPGNPFHALITVIDGDGNWQIEHEPFETKLRRVRLAFDELHVINDGANGDNEARFTNWILKGKHLIERCEVPEGPISDRPSPGDELLEHIPLGFHCSTSMTLGPARVTADNQSLGILTRGVASVSIGSDQISGTFLPGAAPNPPSDEFSGVLFPESFFAFPIGFEETVDHEKFEVTAIPLTAGELMYSVSASISVDYR